VNPGGRSAAAALAAFVAEVPPRLLAELAACSAAAGAAPGPLADEWEAAALHACVRGVVSEPFPDADRAEWVDAFHDLVLADRDARRSALARRYEEYDGLSRRRGRDGAASVPADVAAALARHAGVADPAAFAAAAAPLLEALAEGARATLEAVLADGIERPPTEGLRSLVARLDAERLTWAVGGSGLLAALGLVDRVNDWDVQVEADPERLRGLFADRPHTFHGHGGCHADWKLAFADERTELIPRFAFFVPGGVVHIPLHVTAHHGGLPIASPEGWACAYWLMGRWDEPALRARRAERAERLLAWLAAHGADRSRREELVRQPLPEELRARLDALPAARAVPGAGGPRD